ncbi:hypothetical protein MBLNU457_1244t1 [Dothideomycetes sp. NU457]
MARKARQRISYVLPLANSAGGHRLGVNGLAVDTTNNLLYSGGRDGVICAWDLNLELNKAKSPSEDETKRPPPPATTFRQQAQAHTHWVNDIVLAQSNQALVSASSDITVKVWRPAASDSLPPQPVGLHSDYVKTLAVPDANADWVASGGLDHRVCLWDLTGAGQKLSIDTAEDEGGAGLNRDKGSVYALGVTHSIVASGGPQSTVRVWDPRTGKRITKFVGHTDNIRDILVSEDGGTILTASSDATVKVWSVTAGRCMHTLTMHDASVWSLFSTDPSLSVFYSSDKAGMVAKTDIRGALDYDDGLSIALCQEHQGVHKIVAGGDYLWTATSRPSINRWADFDTYNAEAEMPEGWSHNRLSISNSRTRMTSTALHSLPQSPPAGPKKQIPLKHVLRHSNASFFTAPTAPAADSDTITERNGRRPTVQVAETDQQEQHPIRAQPDSSIEGQNGLIKHILLSDRMRVLTLDTAGEVLMWDLLKCCPVKSFGKRHLEDVQEEMSTGESVANWCSIDTRTGSLAITLEENTCFDAEVYADELEDGQGIEFKEDQRINLGKWVLRYLFADIIEEEGLRDQAFRKHLLNEQRNKRIERVNAPSQIQLPQLQTNGWHAPGPENRSATTPKAINGSRDPTTPGLGIGLVTPGAPLGSAGARLSADVQSTGLARRSTDYFSTDRSPNPGPMSPTVADGNRPATPTATTDPEGKPAASEDQKDAQAEPKDTPSKFGKKFRMGSYMKKLSRTATTIEKEKPAITEEKQQDDDGDNKSEKTDNSREVEENLLGTVQKIRFEYQDILQQQAQHQSAIDAAGGALGESKDLTLETLVTPSMPSETPVLKPPAKTTLLIQEDRPEAGGVADLFKGTVGTLRESVDLIEKIAPMWLGDVLLRNQVPLKDIVKISFCLEPWEGKLPQIATDGNNRLNANRMLRARKILSYVSERIEPAPPEGTDTTDALRPDEYLELWCNNQLVPPRMTLATMRTQVWRSGGDIVLYYKANGKKQILHAAPVQPEQAVTQTAP